MDNSIYSEDDSLPTFQEGDILTCFEEKSQIIDNIEKELDNSYSHRLVSFLKNENTKNSARNSFLGLENQNLSSHRESARQTQRKNEESKDHFFSSFTPQYDNEIQNVQHEQKFQLKRSVEKKSLAIPLNFQKQSQQQLQIQNSQKNYDKYDRPPLSQRVDTRSNVMNITIQQNKDKMLISNAQSQQSLLNQDDKENFFFSNNCNEITTQRTSQSLRSSHEGKLSSSNIKSFYQELQKQMKNQQNIEKNKLINEKNHSDYNEIQTTQLKSIEIDDIKLRNNTSNVNQVQRFANINSTLNNQNAEQQYSYKQKQINSKILQKQPSKCQYVFIDEDENSISISNNNNDSQEQLKTNNNLNQNENKQHYQSVDKKESYKSEKKKNDEQNEILQIVQKIRSIKSQIDDVNLLVNSKKVELDEYVKSQHYHNSSQAAQKSKLDDLGVLKKLTASTLYLNNKYDEMTQNYQEYIQKKDKAQPQNSTYTGDSTQDYNTQETNSFSKQQIQNYLSQNSFQTNNISLSQLQSNSKNLNQYYSVAHSSLQNIKKINHNSLSINNSNEKYNSKKDKIHPSQQLTSKLQNQYTTSNRHLYDNYEQTIQLNEQESHHNRYSLSTGRQMKETISSRERLKTNICEQSEETSNFLYEQNSQIFEQQNQISKINLQSQEQYKYHSSKQINSQSLKSQQQNQIIRAKSQEQQTLQNKYEEVSQLNEFQQHQIQSQASSQDMVHNLISNFSMNRFTNKLNKFLQNNYLSQQSNNKESKTIIQQKLNNDPQQIKQIASQQNKINQPLAQVPSQTVLKQNRNHNQQNQIEQQNLNDQKQKQQRSYSYQEKYAIQKMMQNQIQQKQQ